MRHECDNCLKTYKNQDSYEKHRLQCNSGKTPNQILIEKLMERIDDLETQVRENTNFIQQQRKRVDVIAYLNKELSPTQVNFSDFIKNTTFKTKTLTDYLDSYPITGLTNIITEMFQTKRNNKDATNANAFSIPLRCFIRKKNAFYIRDENTWYEMEDDYELTILINSIQVSLLIMFERLCREKEKAGKNIMQTYFEQKQKILCNGLSCELVAKKIKRTLYDTFKEELV